MTASWRGSGPPPHDSGAHESASADELYVPPEPSEEWWKEFFALVQESEHGADVLLTAGVDEAEVAALLGISVDQVMARLDTRDVLPTPCPQIGARTPRLRGQQA